MQMLWLDPRIARGVLRRLAAYQAKTYDPASDAQPGKILHEMRNGEMAALREVPFGLYYGSVDATPLFVMLAGLYFERTGDDAALVELWPAVEAALAWMDGDGDAGAIVMGIVGVKSVEDPSMNIVTAGDPANSYMMHKIDGDMCSIMSMCAPMSTSLPTAVTMPCGVQMPYQVGQPLTGAQSATIWNWIAQGANNN